MVSKRHPKATNQRFMKPIFTTAEQRALPIGYADVKFRNEDQNESK